MFKKKTVARRFEEGCWKTKQPLVLTKGIAKNKKQKRIGLQEEQRSEEALTRKRFGKREENDPYETAKERTNIKSREFSRVTMLRVGGQSESSRIISVRREERGEKGSPGSPRAF